MGQMKRIVEVGLNELFRIGNAPCLFGRSPGYFRAQEVEKMEERVYRFRSESYTALSRDDEVTIVTVLDQGIGPSPYAPAVYTH